MLSLFVLVAKQFSEIVLVER